MAVADQPTSEVPIQVEDSENRKLSCAICYNDLTMEETFLLSCGHRFCCLCLQTYFSYEITSSRVHIGCPLPSCDSKVKPCDISACVSEDCFSKYLEYSLRRRLAKMKNVRFCPAPNCPYAEISENLRGCPKNLFQCQHINCGQRSCYKCKEKYHGSSNCTADELDQRQGGSGAREALPLPFSTAPATSSQSSSSYKRCPHCSSITEKIDDGACNRMTCTCCGESFCWLCLKPVSYMHYLSPTGCTTWGDQQWTEKKKWMVRCLIWLFSPPLILLLVPLLITFITLILPYILNWQTLKNSKSCRGYCCAAIILSLVILLVISPIVSVLIYAMVVVLALFYVYIILPIHIIWTSSIGHKLRDCLYSVFKRGVSSEYDQRRRNFTDSEPV